MKIKVPEIVIELLDYREVKPIQGNLKDLYSKNFDKLKKSLTEKGGFVPFFVWKDGKVHRLLDGHQRQRLFITENAVFEYQDGNEGYKYPSVIIEAENLKDAKERLLLISSQYGTITQDGLDEFSFDLDSDWLSDTVNFDAIFTEGEEAKEEEEEYDDTPPTDPISKLGDLYELHSLDSGIVHRVQCGDSTDADVVERTMDGEDYGTLFTDPPYGIDYNPNWLSDIHIAKGSPKNKADSGILNDKNELDLSFLFSFKNRLIWGFPYIKDYNATGWIVWDKQPQVNWRGITTPVEVASTTLRKGYDLIHCMWAGFMADKQKGEYRTSHPTQKPLKVTYGCIERFVKSKNVYDPFLGSGTTLIACEQLGRICYGQELDEKYMDVIVRRWIKYMRDNSKRFAISRNGVMLSESEIKDIETI